MKYKLIGKTGIKMSELCFGTMSFGKNADEETSIKMYKDAEKQVLTFLIQPILILMVLLKKYLENV
jgi:aryl-alcohol dehydrogenase-like predicted oxidoreductase